MADNITKLFMQDKLCSQNDKISTVLGKYTERKINKDKTVNYKEVSTDYFLENNNWHIDFFRDIEQYKDIVNNWHCSTKGISFPFNNENITKEIKFITHSKLFSDEWGLQNTIMSYRQYIRRLSQFINEKYPKLNSLTELDIERSNLEWVDWLNHKSIKTVKKETYLDKVYVSKTSLASFLENMINTFNKLTDDREEFEKDVWDVRNLSQYGIKFNKSVSRYYLDFSSITNFKLREDLKEYMKQRLIANNKFSFSTAGSYLKYLPRFINCICELEPTWNDFKDLERHHILKYIEYITTYVNNNIKRKDANPKSIVLKSLSSVENFLIDIQIKEYEIAPKKYIKLLILPDDKPKLSKKSNDQISYIPDFVLEQLFNNINNLHKDLIPVVYVMFKTGLRISDTLELTRDCLIKLNNKFWIQTDIEKVYVEGHRIPIDDELANMLALLIDNSEKNSNVYSNPDNYIFIRYKGSGKGTPYSQSWVRRELNKLALKYNITDELGNIFHFKNHAFRHTYGIKMLNGGADILTVQDLMAHASPEMTMRYARLLDDTKRKTFDNVLKQGVFSFDEGDKLKEETNDGIPSDIIDMLYTNHKLNAINTPYGTCMQRANGKCSYSKHPPCLTCNGGSPCKDLCVGAFEEDAVKYELLINSTKTMIENARIYNRTEIVDENEELLKLYNDIYLKISQGNMIYSRLDKLKRKDI